jgi:micrococcal nuclease
MLIPLLVITLLQDLPKVESGKVSGKVVSIADGDTITILTAEKKQIKIRLNGIDAPERVQPFGTNSKQFVSGLIGEKRFRVVTHGEELYGRTIGEVFVSSRNPRRAIQTQT